jgi:hypothetical protein
MTKPDNMGEAELDTLNRKITLHAEIITYGNAADDIVTERIRAEIESMWNEPMSVILINNMAMRIQFSIRSSCMPGIDPLDIASNTDPRKNFFRVEEKAIGNISFVDGLGCNTGYFQLDNLYTGSTTAAHEFGHTLGLDHPPDIDYRGKGRPGIMYPRGTLVDPLFQYDSTVPAGSVGGTMHPMHRRVRDEDIAALGFRRLRFNKNKAILGDFSNVYHPDHAHWETSHHV